MWPSTVYGNDRYGHVIQFESVAKLDVKGLKTAMELAERGKKRGPKGEVAISMDQAIRCRAQVAEVRS